MADMAVRSIKGHIASLGYFAGIDDEEIAFVTTRCSLRTYSAGEMIFMEGQPSDGIWIVEEGHIKIYKLNPDGGEHILHLRGPGKSFNDVAGLDGGVNPVNASALGAEARVWLMPREVIEYVLLHNNQVALNVIRMLASRVRSLVGQIENLALYSVIVRLARFLLEQSEDPSLSGPGVTRTAIAAHISTTPQTISNVLRTLADTGAIEFDRQRIRILNKKILSSIAMR